MATRNRKRIKLSYRSASSGQLGDRDVDPYGLLYREGSWLVVGYCHLRKDVRSFRLDRIVALVPAPKPKTPDFERPAGFDVRAYAARSPWTFVNPGAGEPEDVELEIRPEAAPVANEDFGAQATRTPVGDGAVRVRFACGNPDFAVSRVLAAKGGIRVVRGEALRGRLQRELGAIAARYR
jgi:proteasome accessory factor B